VASAGLEAVARHRLGGYIPVGAIFTTSVGIGRNVRALRERLSTNGTAGPGDPATDSAH
jgi:hypothetical protein